MNYQSEQIDALMGALAKAQGKMSGAAKDCSNPFFKSKYADLNSIWTACREALSENGLAVVQTVREREAGDICLHTTLGHYSGQWMASSMPIRVKSDGKNNELQMLGSSLSYLRRYSLAALVGVAPADEDDDGNAGTGYKAPQPKEPVTQIPVISKDKENAVTQIPVISKDQVSELYSLLAKCDGDFSDKVVTFLRDKGMTGIDKMLVSFYPPIRKSIDKHLSEQEMKANEA